MESDLQKEKVSAYVAAQKLLDGYFKKIGL
jgi:hypothetical protein